MVFPLLLVLLVGWSDRPAGAETHGDDPGARIRGLWKLHLRDAALKGKGESAPGRRDIKEPGYFKDISKSNKVEINVFKTIKGTKTAE